MLKALILRDFFSFQGETRIDLRPGVNLLLGINGSGKTSFIQALRLLYEGVAGEGVEALVQTRWGGFAQLANCCGERSVSCAQVTYVFDGDYLNSLNPAARFPSEVSYRITIRPSGTGYTLCETLFTEHATQPGRTFRYLDFSNGRGWLSARNDDGSVKMQQYDGTDVSGQELVVRQINDPVHYLPSHTLRKAIMQTAVYNGFNVDDDSALRRQADFSTDIRLRESGDNLTQILNNLKLNHTFDFRRLEETFRRVNPHFESLDISNLNGRSYLFLHERNLSRAIGAAHISDGTLRFLLLESIFFNPDRGALVAVDEPERGLHPDMIRSVAGMMKQAAAGSQLIAATHSPHLLNQFDLEDILVFEKNAENSTVVRRYAETDFPDTDEPVPPGQRWLMGQIGGKRW